MAFWDWLSDSLQVIPSHLRLFRFFNDEKDTSSIVADIYTFGTS
jgi:hypothetical protein